MPRRTTTNHQHATARVARRALRCLRHTPAFRALPAAERNAAEELTGLAVPVRRWRRGLSAMWVQVRLVGRRRPRAPAAEEVWLAEVRALPGETRLRVSAHMGPLGGYLTKRAMPRHCTNHHRAAVARRRALRCARFDPACAAQRAAERMRRASVRWWRRALSAF
ncbi:MAG: hypothetical protein M1826_007066 [Phylliscum demangeonii]|nr:MAG: hypothetical protein M1826_007066 [Phylliscum demangeonii]